MKMAEYELGIQGNKPLAPKTSLESTRATCTPRQQQLAGRVHLIPSTFRIEPIPTIRDSRKNEGMKLSAIPPLVLEGLLMHAARAVPL